MATSFSLVISYHYQPSLHRFISSPWSGQFCAQKMRPTVMACLQRENSKGAKRRIMCSSIGFSLLSLTAKDMKSQNLLALGVSCLALLCALAMREKMKIKLEEKEAAITCLEKELKLEKAVGTELLKEARKENKSLTYELDDLEEELDGLQVELHGAVIENEELRKKLEEVYESLA